MRETIGGREREKETTEGSTEETTEETTEKTTGEIAASQEQHDDRDDPRHLTSKPILATSTDIAITLSVSHF